MIHSDYLAGAPTRYPIWVYPVFRRMPSLYDLEDIAWVLRSDARTKKIGFVRARDLKPADRHVLDEDDWP